MATVNMKQRLDNNEYALTWDVEDGAHTVKLIKFTQDSDPKVLVLSSSEVKTMTYTESS